MTLPTPDALKNYTTHLRQRQAREDLKRQQRYCYGWEQARIAADLLKTRYGAKQVLLFGSLLFPKAIHADSDIDLAVWGLSLAQYSDAVGSLLLEINGFSVDLVRLEGVQPGLKTYILQAGVEL